MNAPGADPLRITLVDLSGEAKVRYLPLGILYLKAALDSDPEIAGHVSASTRSFLAGTSIAAMAEQIVDSNPSIIGMSCQGWNISIYRHLIPTLRQLLPESVIVLGGNHVSYQGQRWLRELPEVDIVVNGEGEETFRQLIRSYLGRGPDLSDIAGLTYRASEVVVTTTPRERASSLDEVASPFLIHGLVPGDTDIALWETNRGCPYRCAFCIWGGAVGQKVTRALPDRLMQELEIMGQAGVPGVFICDANFGILPQDVEIAKAVVDVRRRYGALSTLHVNWAKNHASRVEEILDILRTGDVHTNVYLALQTLNTDALKLAGRDERGRPEMIELARRILAKGGEVGAELIFGLPGETLAQFRAAYDQLFLQFPSLLVHPLWILPNTTYDSDRNRFGLVTLRPDPMVDYEGVLEHTTLPVADNKAGLRLLMADDILVGTGYARTTLRGLACWSSIPVTQLLDAFADFIAIRDDQLSAQLAAAFAAINSEVYFHRHLRGRVRSFLFADRAAALMVLLDFVESLPAPAAVLQACRELARYDCALLPRADLHQGQDPGEDLKVAFDVPAVARQLLSPAPPSQPPHQGPVTVRITHEPGFARHLDDAIDLSGTWRGRITSIDRAPTLTREGTPR